jgi:transposase-like protein
MYIQIYRNGVCANVNENWDDETKDREFRADNNFYAPRKRQGKFHIPEEDFVDTVKRVFAQGGGYSQVASELGLTPSAVYTRANRLRKDGISLPATQSKGVAEDAVKILGELGVEVDYTPVKGVKVEDGTANEAMNILKELGCE